MSEKEGFPNLNLLNAAPIGYKVEEAARPCPQILARRKLADISNLPQNWKSQPIPTTITKEYVEQLRKELNSRKDRLKQLQHELGCKNGSLQARNSKLEENVIKEDEPSKEGEDHKKPRNAKKRTRSLCLGSSEESQSKDDAGNRLPVRRHSSRFEVFKPDDDSVSEMYDPKIPKCSLPDASVNNEEHVANRPSGRRQSARFKSATPSPIPDETVQENGSSIAEMSVINEGHAVQRPSVRRQSTRLKAVTPCPIPDETVHEISVETVHETSVETSVITEGNDMKRPSVRRQSTRLKAVTQCPIPDETVHETAVETVHETAVETVHETAVETVHETSVETVHETSVETSVITEGHAIQRTSVRKQSIRSRTKIPKQADDPSEMDCTISTNCTSLDEPVPPVTDSGSTSADTPVENENDGSCSSGWGCDSQGSRKPSLGRPSRVATRKVQTYRERSLKDKMRRPVQAHQETEKRPHSLSPSFSVAVDSPTTAEEDAARCLIHLSRGHFLHGENSNENFKQNNLHPQFTDGGTYTCKTCDRVFASSQALGGHRTSHTKPKNDKKSASFHDSGIDDFLLSKKKIPPLSLHTAAGDGGGRRISSPRVHECSYCGAEFASGPALGGHMRRHRAGTTSPLPEPKRPRNGLALDLNFPALEDESQRFKYELKYEEVQLFLTH
ncbi:hypothetical protein SASPL_136851 [Salvia splendens]|uniref:C2H2-type domain-containing protein n=1 Tax=Salvia splendens TaxID=180675 RepID=A0A8X8X0I4_SALSN|nr:hypothetical protein SASPL_136851 [Salvia splendens]